MTRPRVVSATEWQAERDALLVKEKELTHALDALAAQRRRLPMVKLRIDYEFTAPDQKKVQLTDLFAGRRQLVIYHFMLAKNQDFICDGCASFTDNIGHQEHLNARDTTLILMAPAPQSEIEPVRQRFGWTVPWFSSHGSDFHEDLEHGEGFGLSVLLRNDDEVFRTYYTNGRGVDRLRLDLNLLDLTPYGRQEEWEDSPQGWPQTPTMAWMRLRDEY
ncbi:DUF899 domain-containing protein [Lentzea sp. JNUCC 0626]|uniref:DUF899 domain-containing protein n=1 Tax=Lentzea sp. JNUCC 0626 TaxID=3367513 RepID=UPI003747DA87